MISPGNTGKSSDIVLKVTSGEALTTNDAVYISTADGKAYKCDADDLTKMDFAGFVVEGVAINNDVYIKVNGIMDGFSSLTTGDTYFVSGTAGAVTNTSPANVTVVGIARSATIIEIRKQTIRHVVFESDGTWTKRPGLKYAVVEVIGGGGAGGGSTNTYRVGGGGGAGGYAKKMIPEDELSATETVTVGTGGTGGTGAGGAGNATTFGAHCTGGAGSGGGGDDNASDGGAGGTGSSGDFNVKGGGGSAGLGDSGSSSSHTGTGGSSVLGGGADSDAYESTQGGNGAAGGAYGGGGSGGGNANSSTSRNGGAGADGVCIVTEYY